jgi:hypothetical protein
MEDAMATASSTHADKWRRRAEEYRMLADCACDDAAHDHYADLADDYDKLTGEFAERGADGSEQPPRQRSPSVLGRLWRDLTTGKYWSHG